MIFLSSLMLTTNNEKINAMTLMIIIVNYVNTVDIVLTALLRRNRSIFQVELKLKNMIENFDALFKDVNNEFCHLFCQCILANDSAYS